MLASGEQSEDESAELERTLATLGRELLALGRQQQMMQDALEVHRRAMQAMLRPCGENGPRPSVISPEGTSPSSLRISYEFDDAQDLDELKASRASGRFSPLGTPTAQPVAGPPADSPAEGSLEKMTSNPAADPATQEAKAAEADDNRRGFESRSTSRMRTLMREDSTSVAKGLKLAQERRNWFDTMIGVLVLLNAFVMVLDLESQGNGAGFRSGIIEEDVWSGFSQVVQVLEHFFAVAFILELIYRVATERFKYFKEAMNVFDSVLVMLACVDLYILTPLLTTSLNNTTTLRLLRTIKLVRAIRIVRALRLFRGLRLLIKACSSFLPSLCWSMALLGLFMMMGGLFMGNLLQDYILDEDIVFDKRQWMWLHYGTAYRAMYTMFEMTFAGNWPVYARPVLENAGHGYVVFYFLYITFVVFAVIRVISAIFLRETLEAANNDAEMMVQERLRKKTTYVHKLEGIFQACDESGDGVLSEEELTELMRDPRVQVYLESLEIDVQESTALFHLLQNGDGVISCDDFIEGILRCKGPARAIDQILLTNDIKKLGDSVLELTTSLEKAGIIATGKSKNKYRRNIEDELALMPTMGMTLSGRYVFG